mmetsp:Transcript_111005/g.264870  ORF Transcript_111005/g.264870 Transcript_111005/m.264870 type:complete len:203 (-) Transcript_111005:741-1349(-)
MESLPAFQPSQLLLLRLPGDAWPQRVCDESHLQVPLIGAILGDCQKELVHKSLGRCIIHLRCFRHLQEVLLNARGQSDVVSVFRLTDHQASEPGLCRPKRTHLETNQGSHGCSPLTTQIPLLRGIELLIERCCNVRFPAKRDDATKVVLRQCLEACSLVVDLAGGGHVVSPLQLQQSTKKSRILFLGQVGFNNRLTVAAPPS